MVAVVAIALLATARAMAADLEAHVDRTRIAAGETVGLLLRGRALQVAPDLAPLQEDFDVLDVRRSQRTTIVNGRRDSSMDWHVTLAPRRTGWLTIPALEAGSAASAPLALDVSDAPQSAPGHASANGPRGVFVEAEVDDTTPYVQGKVLLTARIHHDGSLIDGALFDPQVAGAVVERVGEDTTFQREVDGQLYHVIERQYAVFPQSSGELHIPPLVFEGRRQEAAPARPRDPFGDAFGSLPRDPFADAFGGSRSLFGGSLLEEFFGPGGEPVRLRTASLDLEVQPRPDEFTGDWWLPAREVELIEHWGNKPPVLRVGEPVHRMLAIRAAGLSGAQLPELELPAVEGAKQYSEPAIDDTASEGGEVISVKLQETTLIPTRAGTLTLPAIELAWWDTTADEARTARLPAQTLQVAPGAEEHAALAPPPAAPTSGPGEPPPPAAVAAPIPGRTGLAWHPAAWIAGSCVLLFAAALVGRRLWRSAEMSSDKVRGGRAPDRAQVKRAERGLRAACETGDAEAAAAALRGLGQVCWPGSPPPGGRAWAQRLGAPGLRAPIAELHRVQYSPHRDSWNGSSLWIAYRDAIRSVPKRRPGAIGVLPELYPSG
jgi:hypothetical protein